MFSSSPELQDFKSFLLQNATAAAVLWRRSVVACSAENIFLFILSYATNNSSNNCSNLF